MRPTTARGFALAAALAAPLACEARASSEAPKAKAPAPPVAPAAPYEDAPGAHAPPSTSAAPAGGMAAAASVAPKPERRPGAWANLDPDDDFLVGPPDAIDDCDGELARAGVTFAKARLAVHEIKNKKSKITCGAPQVVTYLKGPGNITYSAAPLLTCAMAAALATFERIAQEEARAAFTSPIVRIEHLGTYNCREMLAYPGWVSEHSYANAIDVARFVLKDGRVIDVDRDFDTGEGEPKRPAGRFLRAVSRRANDEDVFSHVLTPFYDALHKNHFHLDLARYRTDGTRPQGDVREAAVDAPRKGS